MSIPLNHAKEAKGELVGIDPVFVAFRVQKQTA